MTSHHDTRAVHFAGVGITAVLVGIGLYDVLVGGWLLASSHPFLAHGPDTPWLTLADAVEQASPPNATLGLFRRLGAFSLHAGVCTIVWAALAHRRPWLRTALFGTYALTGGAFGATDAAYFPNTPYLHLKHAIGAFFVVALLAHVAGVAGAEGA